MQLRSDVTYARVQYYLANQKQTNIWIDQVVPDIMSATQYSQLGAV